MPPDAGRRTIAARARDEILAHVSTPASLWRHCAGSAAALATARLLQEAGRSVRRVFVGAQLLSPDDELAAEAERVAASDRRLLVDRMRVDNAYVELDAFRPERARIVGRSYRQDVSEANHHLVRARQDPGRHRVSAPVDVVVARDAIAGAARLHRARTGAIGTRGQADDDERDTGTVTGPGLSKGGREPVSVRPSAPSASCCKACCRRRTGTSW